MISIKHYTTSMTDMRAHTQRLFHERSTVRALLAGEMGRDCNDWNVMQNPIVVHPLEENPPSSIMDALCQVMIANHIADLKVFIGNQVVRRDKRVCLLSGKILTLPLHFQIALCQRLSGLFAVLTSLFLSGELSMQTLELLFRFAKVSRVLNGVALRVGQKSLESHIDADGFPRWNMLDAALCLDSELDIVAISTLENANSLDLLAGECFDLLFLIPNQAQTPDPAPIRERDMLAIRLKFPTGLLVFDRPVIVLEPRIAFFPRGVFTAIGLLNF